MTLSHDHDSRDCPSAHDLRAFAERGLHSGDAADIQTHVSTCQICTETVDALRAIPTPTLSTDRARQWRELGREPAAAFARVWATAQPDEPEPGQLWTTQAPARDTGGRIVVLLDTNVLLTAAPICLELGLRGDRDVSVGTHESPLGYSFMVETWNLLHTDRALLKRYLGRLGPDPMGAIQVLLRGGSEWLGERVGPPLYGAGDPRLEFQQRERATCTFLQRSPTPPATPERRPAETVTLDGVAVRARRRTLELSFEAVALALLERGFGEGDIGAVADAERRGRGPVGSALADAIDAILQADDQTYVVQPKLLHQPAGARQAFAETDAFRRRVVDLAARRGVDPIACLRLVESEWLRAAARESESETVERRDEGAWMALLDRLILRAIERVK